MHPVLSNLTINKIRREIPAEFREDALQEATLAALMGEKSPFQAAKRFVENQHISFALPHEEEAYEMPLPEVLTLDLLKTLTEREEKVIIHTILKEEELESVGKLFGVGKMRTSQIRSKALAKLERNLERQRKLRNPPKFRLEPAPAPKIVKITCPHCGQVIENKG